MEVGGRAKQEHLPRGLGRGKVSLEAVQISELPLPLIPSLWRGDRRENEVLEK